MYNTVTVLKKIEELLSGTKHIFHINLMFFAKKKKTECIANEKPIVTLVCILLSISKQKCNILIVNIILTPMTCCFDYPVLYDAIVLI